MVLYNISAVPVLDDEQHVVATLSVSDLRGLTSSTLSRLTSPVFEFLESESRVNGVCVDQVRALQGSATVGQAVEMMLENGIHRVWIVDDEERFGGVVSLSDVITLFAI